MEEVQKELFKDSKSLFDRKLYKLVTLPSGLKCLLISYNRLNEDVELIAAAALAVQVGSFSDPKNLEGCAHCLEHMLFMGSEKYPEENYYDSFVSKNGGSCNAYTEGEYTVYQFDINSNYFEEALDIFANCIIKPRISMDSLDREVKAIDSEFKIAQTSDSSRLQQLLSHLTKENNILHKFAWGNKSSLYDIPKEMNLNIYDNLKDFHSKYYLPNQMTLVVLSNHSLDSLESFVSNSFTNPNFKPSPPLKLFDVHENVFDKKVLNQITRVIPIKREHKIHFIWSIPATMANYKEKPHEYIGHMIGYEGEGSLLAFLKKENLASEVSAGVSCGNFDENSQNSLFQVAIKLTDIGVVNWMKVAFYLFSYLTMIKKEPLSEQMFQEMKDLAFMQYQYQDEEDAEDITDRLSVQMLPHFQRNDNDLLTAPFLLYNWTPEAIQHLLERYFTLENVKIILYSHFYQQKNLNKDGTSDSQSGDDEEDDDDDEEDSDGSDEDDDEDESEGDEDDEDDEEDCDGNEITNDEASMDLNTYQCDPSWIHLVEFSHDNLQEEPHFKVQFKNDEIPKSLKKYWKTADYKGIFKYPTPNIFIPTDFDLIDQIDPALKRCKLDPSVKTYPKQILIPGVSSANLWHLTETKFNLPKVEIYLRFFNPSFIQNVQFSVFQDLQWRLLKDNLTDDLYNAMLAGLDCEIYCDFAYWMIKLSGFHHKVPILIDRIYDQLFQLSHQFIPFSSQIERICQTLLSKYENSILKSSQLASNNRLDLLLPWRFPLAEKIVFLREFLESKTLQSAFSEFLSSSLSNITIDSLAVGNISEEISKNLILDFYKKGSTALATTCQRTPILSIENNQILLHHSVPKSIQDKNRCIELYYQCSEYNIEALTLLDIVEALISEPYFDNLRTKQQLGYSVHCGMRCTHSVLGFYFTVLSASHSLKDILNSILNFSVEVSNLIRGFSPEHYDTVIKGLIKNKQKSELSLNELSNQFWSPIEDHNFNFNEKEQQIQFLENSQNSHSQEKIVNFCREIFNVKPRLLLSSSSFEKLENYNENIETITLHYDNVSCLVIEDIKTFHDSSKLSYYYDN